MTLTHDDVAEDHERYGKPTAQALAAKEIFELYTWWTALRPLRQEADTIELEKQHAEEDRQMLHRLIDIRSSLWT